MRKWVEAVIGVVVAFVAVLVWLPQVGWRTHLRPYGDALNRLLLKRWQRWTFVLVNLILLSAHYIVAMCHVQECTIQAHPEAYEWAECVAYLILFVGHYTLFVLLALGYREPEAH